MTIYVECRLGHMGEGIKLGNREKLVAAARSCLLKAGYGATTVRDLVAESGANQASINYHFGSKDQLLNQALFDLNREWGAVLFEALGIDETGTASVCTDEVSAIDLWQRVISSIVDNEQLWFVNFESIPYVQHDAEIRKMNAAGQAASRDALAHAFGGLEPDSDPERRRIVGSHYYSLLTGLALQLLTDRKNAPTARDLVSADWRSPSAAAS